MESLELTLCPQLDNKGELCGAIAKILDRFELGSTAGPIELVKTRCVNGHFLMCLAEEFVEPEFYALTDDSDRAA